MIYILLSFVLFFQYIHAYKYVDICMHTIKIFTQENILHFYGIQFFFCLKCFHNIPEIAVNKSLLLNYLHHFHF